MQTYPNACLASNLLQRFVCLYTSTQGNELRGYKQQSALTILSCQKAVSVYFTGKQILPSGFAEQCYMNYHLPHIHGRLGARGKQTVVDKITKSAWITTPSDGPGVCFPAQQTRVMPGQFWSDIVNIGPIACVCCTGGGGGGDQWI